MKSSHSLIGTAHPTHSTMHNQSQIAGGISGSAPKFFANVGDPALKRSFKGHKDAITSIAFNPNLKQVISSSLDNTLMVWNFKPSLRPYRFIGHKGPVYDICVAPSGNVIASCSADETIRLWNNTVEGHSQVIKSHSAPVKSVAFSSDGSLLLSGSDDKTLKVFQVSDRKFQFSITAHQNWIRTCQFSPDTRIIGSGSDDRTVKLWDVTKKNNVNTFSDHEGTVNCIRFHPDGTCIASSSTDKSIKIWDIRSSRLLQHYDAHQESVNQIAFHPNGRFLLSTSNDSTLKIWDLRQGHILYTLYGHEGASTCANFSPCGDYFCSAGVDSIVMVWKSNLNEVEQEVIEEFGGSTTSVQGGQISQQHPGMSGGITSNRKSKNVGAANKSNTSAIGQQSRYNIPSKTTSHPLTNQQPAPMLGQKNNNIMSTSTFDHNATQRSRTVIVPPESDLNRYEQQHHHAGGAGGSGEELAQALDKIVSQLEIMSKTLHVIEQRVSINEEQISTLQDYFRDNRLQQPPMMSNQGPLGYNQNIMNQQMHSQQLMRYDLDALKDNAYQVEQQVRVVKEMYGAQPATVYGGTHNFGHQRDRDDFEDEGEDDQDLKRE